VFRRYFAKPLSVITRIKFYHRQFLNWLSQITRSGSLKEVIRQHIFNPEESIFKKSLSVGFGIFMGIIPIWGFQTISALLLAGFLRLNKALTLIASHISMPPLIPLVIYCSLQTGKIWTGSSRHSAALSQHLDKHMIGRDLQQYLLGSITLAVLAGLVAFVCTWGVLQALELIRKNRAGRLTRQPATVEY